MLWVAIRCGFPTVRHFEEHFGDMTSQEVIELMAYERLEPRLEHRIDYLFAQLNSTVASSAFGAKKAYKASDFLANWSGRRRKPQQSEKDMKRVLMGFGR